MGVLYESDDFSRPRKALCGREDLASVLTFCEALIGFYDTRKNEAYFRGCVDTAEQIKEFCVQLLKGDTND